MSVKDHAGHYVVQLGDAKRKAQGPFVRVAYSTDKVSSDGKSRQTWVYGPNCANAVWESVNKHRLVIKLDERKIVTGSTVPHLLAKIFVTRMLTCDLFAVAYLLVYTDINIHCTPVGLLTVIQLLSNLPMCDPATVDVHNRRHRVYAT